MIERLLIKNFQAHEKLDLVFDPAVTVIVGRTDSGKSSIIRALRWALLNQPRGSSFTKHGESFVGVKVKIDGATVSRSKDGNDNHYSLGDSKFTAFGSNVPETITEFLKVDDLNFQQQHDAPFWLSLSSGEVSRRLNEIVDLTVIDKATSEIKSQLLAQKKLVESNLIKLKKEKEALTSLDWVADAKVQYEDIKGVEDSVERWKTIQRKLEILRDDIVSARDTVTQNTEILDALRPIGKKLGECLARRNRAGELVKLTGVCVQIKKIAEQPEAKIDEIEKNYEECKKLTRKISSLGNLLTTISSFDAIAKEEITYPDLDGLIETYQIKSRRSSLLSADIDAIKSIVIPEPLDLTELDTAVAKRKGNKAIPLEAMLDYIKAKKAEIEKDEKALDAAEKEIASKTQGICPICGSDLYE